MTVIVPTPRGMIEDRFPNLNKRSDGNPVDSHYYSWVNREEPKELHDIREVDLEKIILWDPKLPEGDYHGIHYFQRRIKEESQEKIPLGLEFAEAMRGRPWPTQWDGIRFIGCVGTLVTISRRTNRDAPMYPRLEVNLYESPAKTAMRWWSTERKPAKNMRIAFYPIKIKS